MKQKTRWFFLFIPVCYLLFSALIPAEASKLQTTTVVVSPEVKVEVEVAISDEDRAHGLMFRKFLPPDSGMLFVFADLDLHGFWMKNTWIPLDLIWLNERKEIVYMVTAVPCEKDPCVSYVPLQKAKYVLEVNSGFFKKHGLKIGRRLEFVLPEGIKNEI